MQLYKYLPVPSDRMGLLWVLGSISDGCIVEYGPAGTTHYSLESLMQFNAELRAGLYTTDLDESEVVLGDTGRLAETLREVDRMYRPAVIFVVGSSLVAVTGVDLKRICDELRPELAAELIPFDSGGFKGDYSVGIREALLSLAEHLVRPSVSPKAGTYNIIGCTIDMYNFAADLREIVRMMKAYFGYSPAAIFTAGSSLEAIRQAAGAEFNLVLRTEGIAAAEFLKERYGQPYLVGVPYGLAGTVSWLTRVGESFSLPLQSDQIKEESEGLRRHLFRFRQALVPYRNLSATISGNLDFLTDFAPFAGVELGLDVKTLIVNHRVAENQEIPEQWRDKIVNSSQEEIVDGLLRDPHAIILGDGMLLERAAESAIKVQVANPNLDRTLLYEYTPFMGFRGATYLTEVLFNAINADRRRLYPRF